MTLLLAASATITVAQTTTATIEGTVFDSTGAVLPEVAIDIRGETLSRSVVSDSRGFYRAITLPPGRYIVDATLAGFQPQRVENVDVALNRTATVDLRLAVASRTETIQVRPFAMLIDPTRSSTSQLVTAQQIASLPLYDRDYLSLVLLTPGAIVNATARSPFGDRDTRGAILGERAGNAIFLIDGFANNDDFRGGVFQAYSQDAIQEFEVISAGYKAEFGHGSGGVVNAITRSGTNRVHGSGFMFLRDDHLDASNVPGDSAPELARYNGGATIGGPVTANRSWYFGSFEHIFERRAAIFPANIPTVLKEGEDFSQRPSSGNTRLFGKYSRVLSAANHLLGEAGWSRLQNTRQLATAAALPSASNDNASRTFLGAITLDSMVSRAFTLESSVSYREQRFGQNSQLGDGFSYNVTFVDGGGPFDYGARYGSKQMLDQSYFTMREAGSWFTGSHAVKTGIEYVRTAVDGSNGEGLVDTIYTTKANFARFGKESFQIPQGVGFIEAGDEVSHMRNHGASLFAQDDWRLGTHLTVNLGVRYDYDSTFADANNVAPRLGVTWAPNEQTAIHANWGVFYDRYRLGIAQAVPEFGGFNGKTVVELNYPRLAADGLDGNGRLGRLATRTSNRFILHEHFNIAKDAVVKQSNVEELTTLAPEQFLTELRNYLAASGAFLPGAFLPVDFSPTTGYLRQDQGAAFQDQIRVATPFKTPYNRTFTLGGERMLSGELSAGVTYVHRAIDNIAGVRLTNLTEQSRQTGRARTTDDGPLLRSYGPWYDGNYDALILSIDKRFNGRFQMQANYTYARGRDNLLNANLGLGVGAQGGGAVPTDNLNLEFDRGNSDLLVPHALVASGLAILPAGFSLSGVFRATSGPFFSATSGPVDYDGDGISSPRVVGTTRNQFRGPRSLNTDLRIEKRFTVGRYTASALVEWFNLLNARNPRLIDTSYTPTGPSETFGTIRVPLPGRETQLGLRLTF